MHIRILTLNFFLRPPGISDHLTSDDWKRHRIRLFARREFNNYDIITFQETFAFGSSRRKKLINLARNAGFHHSFVARKMPWYAGRIDAGLVILSRFPIVATEEWTFEERGTQVGDFLAAKGIIYAKIQLNATHLHLFTTHLQSSDSEKAIVKRHKQFSEAKQFIDNTLLKHGRTDIEPVLFSGDMNVDARKNADDGVNNGWEYDLMINIYSGRQISVPNTTEFQAKYDICDVCYEALGEHPITTSKLRASEPADRKCIDFIFSLRPAASDGQKNIHFENVRVEKFLVEEHRFDFLSDHFGIAADVIVDDVSLLSDPVDVSDDSTMDRL
ncbi:unnamed protein product [Didymodactylos carnosus]|uniref:sphingomyelin phosphodiesterase n=1 Tax=Didymodactylos carnosus TaxID=1234261 RepID=A0A814XJ68_9BILA|nr:unnamed protein product [Didymodactylos carnosus]CAF1448089.1 unnamed protein product [Didymodactylos carnosus]CAF3981109.1 unnamed protein product [Didymodactylos carnosus]CAF4243275.1 unnamed protein product [Didymodactylos carnosus]